MLLYDPDFVMSQFSISRGLHFYADYAIFSVTQLCQFEDSNVDNTCSPHLQNLKDALGASFVSKFTTSSFAF